MADGRWSMVDGWNRGRWVVDATQAVFEHGRMGAGTDHEHVADVVFVVYDGIQALDLTGPWEVFHGANAVLADAAPDRTPYRLHLCSTDGRTIRTESGIGLSTAHVADAPRPHTLVVPGGFGAFDAGDDVVLLAAVRELAAGAMRVVTVCTGAYVAAAAGLCDGKRVATHWARAGRLRRRFPAVEVDLDPIFVRDGELWSSAGVTAGIDLALALVEHDHGADVAQVVARWLVMFLRRPGGQSQFATPVWSERATAAPVRRAQDRIDADPAGDHRVGALAREVGMSERHFTRCFTEQIGTSPAQYVAAVRVEAARRALERTTDTVEVIARRCGFGTAETMRRTFLRTIGVAPDQYRRRFRTTPMPGADHAGHGPRVRPTDTRPATSPHTSPHRAPERSTT
jgi:transcriptional regulator GlxA family with amidase domain